MHDTHREHLTNCLPTTSVRVSIGSHKTTQLERQVPESHQRTAHLCQRIPELYHAVYLRNNTKCPIWSRSRDVTNTNCSAKTTSTR
eukprot:4840073-Amphidinium_carterae.4